MVCVCEVFKPCAHSLLACIAQCPGTFAGTRAHRAGGDTKTKSGSMVDQWWKYTSVTLKRYVHIVFWRGWGGIISPTHPAFPPLFSCLIVARLRRVTHLRPWSLRKTYNLVFWVGESIGANLFWSSESLQECISSDDPQPSCHPHPCILCIHSLPWPAVCNWGE